jgi:hypothetical protein
MIPPMGPPVETPGLKEALKELKAVRIKYGEIPALTEVFQAVEKAWTVWKEQDIWRSKSD